MHLVDLVARRLGGSRLAAALLVLGQLALPGSARAEDSYRPRFHILSGELTRRLAKKTPAMKGPMESIGIYRKAGGETGGTAFLVGRPDAEGNALMLTAHHVALYKKKTVAGDRVLFYPGGAGSRPVSVEVLGTVVSNRHIDYALLRVKLPSSLTGLEPVHHEGPGAGDLIGGERLYNPSFPRIWQEEATAPANRRFVSSSPRRRIYKKAIKGLVTPKMMQVGVAEGWKVEGFEMTRIPQQNGSSGSPVFSSGTNKLVGMLTAGSSMDLALVRPVRTVFGDILKRARTVSDPALRAAVESVARAH